MSHRESWTNTTVAGIADPGPRSIVIGPFGSNLRADLYTKSGVPVVRGQDITDGRFLDESTMPSVAQSTADSLKSCIVRPGDLIFPHRGAIGRVGLVVDRDYLLSSRMMKLTCDRRKADPAFVFYYFRGPGREELLNRASTVGTPGIGQPLRSLKQIPICLPPLETQRAIATVLGALDYKIAANAKLAQLHENLAEALFNRVRNGAGLQQQRLADLVHTQYGLTASAIKRDGPRLLRVTDINKKPWVEWSSSPGCDIGGGDLEKYGVKPGDILVARMADPGKVAYIDEGSPPAVFASYLVRLVAKEPGAALYIYYFLRSADYQDYAAGAMSGSVQKNMNAKVIVDTEISISEVTRLSEL